MGRKKLRFPDGGEGAIPWDIAAEGDAKFYFTDLGRRGVYSIEPDGKSELVHGDPEMIFYRVSAGNNLLAISSREQDTDVMNLKDGEVVILGRLRVNDGILAMRIAAWIATGVLLAGCVGGELR